MIPVLAVDIFSVPSQSVAQRRLLSFGRCRAEAPHAHHRSATSTIHPGTIHRLPMLEPHAVLGDRRYFKRIRRWAPFPQLEALAPNESPDTGELEQLLPMIDVKEHGRRVSLSDVEHRCEGPLLLQIKWSAFFESDVDIMWHLGNPCNVSLVISSEPPTAGTGESSAE